MGYKVLVTDDSAFMRSMVSKVISETDSEVIGEAVDGADGVEKYKELNPDIVFLDIMMPNMNGIDALKAIKAINPNARVVMCTSVGQEKVITQAVEAGASDFIVKPFKKEDIIAVLSK